MDRLQCSAMRATYPGRAKLGRLTGLAAALCVLQACATTPFSYLDGKRWNVAELDTSDTYIVSVDGHSYPYNSSIRVEPGLRHIVFETRPVAGFTFSPQRALDIDIKPCSRYYFEAKRNTSLQQDFEPRVNYVEAIPGCGGASVSAMHSSGY